MEQPGSYTSSKKILSTILLNDDTHTILDEYIVAHVKMHPHLLTSKLTDAELKSIKKLIDSEVKQRKQKSPITITQDGTIVTVYGVPYDPNIDVYENIEFAFGRYGPMDMNFEGNKTGEGIMFEYDDVRDADDAFNDKKNIISNMK